MTKDGTFLVEPTTEPNEYDLGFHEGYEDHKNDTTPAYTLRAGSVMEHTTFVGSDPYFRVNKITPFVRGYIAGFVKSHEDTYG